MRSCPPVLVVLALLLVFAPAASAAPGDLDTTFGDGGRLTVAPAGKQGSFSDVAIQPDGKIVLSA